MYEFNYVGTDSNFKIWFSSIEGAEVTMVDGLRTHPWYNYSVPNETIVQKMLVSSDVYEFGDSWYNISKRGKAFVFIKAN